MTKFGKRSDRWPTRAAPAAQTIATTQRDEIAARRRFMSTSSNAPAPEPQQDRGQPDQNRRDPEDAGNRPLEERQRIVAGLDERAHEVLLEHRAEHHAEYRRRDRERVR